MQRNLWMISTVVLVLGFPSIITAQTSKVDVSGTWIFTVQTDAGTTSPTVTLKQDGDKLTGHYSSEALGEADLTGSVKGRDLKFTFTASVQGASFQVTYTGTIEDSGLKGTVDLAGMAQGTFTAKRK